LGHLLRFKLGKTLQDIDCVFAEMVRDAYETSEAYRNILQESGTSPSSISGVRDLPALPIISKETLFRHYELRDVLRRGVSIGRCVTAGTSGSTGLPITVYMSQAEAFYRRVQLLRAWRNVERLPFPLRIADVGTLVKGDRPIRARRLPATTVLRVPIGLPAQGQAEAVSRFRPGVLSGPPTALSTLSEVFRRGASRSPRLRLVATRGEVLHQETRRLIEEAFPAGRVADFYNCEEIGNIAWECPLHEGTFHINTDTCILEIVDERGDQAPAGTEGRVIVTNLYNRTMPLIRYDLRDRGVLVDEADHPCSCGSKSPSMAVVQGRDDDYLRLRSGRRVSPRLIATSVNRAFCDLSPIGAFDRHFRRFQVVQDAEDHLTIRVIPEHDREVDFQSVIAAALKGIHLDLRFSVEIVDDLPLGPSGKFRKVVCALEPPEASS